MEKIRVMFNILVWSLLIIGTKSELRRILFRPRSFPDMSQRPIFEKPTGEESAISKGKFVSEKVKVSLNCETEETIVKLNFTQPFRGVVIVGDNRSPCRIRGNGGRNYSLRVPHNDCGTKHVVSRGSFFNSLFIRYHPSLEMEGDQLKSILCKFGTGSLFVG